jgi:hypothetical protein
MAEESPPSDVAVYRARGGRRLPLDFGPELFFETRVVVRGVIAYGEAEKITNRLLRMTHPSNAKSLAFHDRRRAQRA